MRGLNFGLCCFRHLRASGKANWSFVPRFSHINTNQPTWDGKQQTIFFMKTITKCMLLISIGLMAGLNGNAQTVINGGNVSGTWTKVNSPYQVNGDIAVAAGTTLTIEPGVTVAFANNIGLTINGQLLAQGTSNDNIVFTRQSTNTWIGLTFSAAGENKSVVEYASIKYANKNGIYIISGIITLSNDVISNNSASLYNPYGANWYYGGGIYIGGGTVTLSNNTISNNTANYNGGGVYISGGTVTLNNNAISNNTANSSYGGGIYMDKSTVEMYNNVISGNSATQAGGGVYISNMIANVRNNVISNNKHAAAKSGNGGGISLYNSSSMIINNTIAYNDAENGGGIYCSNGSSPVVINNIIYGNTSSLVSQIYINDNNSAPKMLYNLNQSNSWGFTTGVNYNWEANYDDSNFDANPQFVNYALQNYRLKSTSPCINAGIEDVTGLGLPNVDLDGNARIYGGRIDLGAYEYGAPPSGIENVNIQNQLLVYPNPSRDGIFQLATNNNDIHWVVFDMNGKQISQGNTALVDLSFCSKGIYMVKVQTGKDIVTAKLVKL